MQLSDSSFPYPVLGNGDAIGGPKPDVSVIDHIPLKERIADPYRWEFKIDLKNPDIEALIADGKASYLYEVKCSATFLRFCKTTRECNFPIELGRRDVNKRVEFSLWVVADDCITDYRNAAAHADYRMLEPFEVERGAPLAFLKAYHWDAELCYEDLTSLRSILKIEKHNDPAAEFLTVDVDGDYVRLCLPNTQFDGFLAVTGNETVAPVLHSSILLFALQSALVRYNENRERRWARALEEITRRDPKRFGSFDLGNVDDASGLALRLLNNPTKRLGETIAELTRGTVRPGTNSEDDE